MRTVEDDQIKAIKIMLGEWGMHKRIEWRQNGIGYKSPAFVIMIKPSKLNLDYDDPKMESFRKVLISLKSYNYPMYQAVRKVYADEEDMRDIARQLGVVKRTVNRRLCGAYAFIRSNWGYMEENTACMQIQLA